MAIMSDGFNTYVQRKGGWELVTPESTEMSVGGKPVYRYDRSSGVLELAVPPSELEKIASQYGEQLPEGFAVDISIPPLGNQHFKGVKSFKSLVDEEGNYLSAPSSNMAEKTAVAKEQVISGRLGELSVGYTMDEIVANAPSKPTPSLYQCVKDYVNRFF